MRRFVFPEMLRRPYILLSAAASGLLLTASFPKLEWEFLAWIALVPFGLALRKLKPGEAFWFGWITGGVHFLSLLYWLVPTIRIYGKLPAALSVFILLIFCGFLALFFALTAWSLSRLAKTPMQAAIWLPVIWVAAEYLRTFIFTGFPWGLLGHSQYSRLYLIQLADLTGVYGLSYLIAAANAAVVLIVAAAMRLKWQQATVGWRSPAAASMTVILILGAVLFYGHQRLGNVDQSLTSAGRVKIAAIQGNIAQSDKWDDAYKIKTIDIYNRLSAGISDERPELIVWPETAAPFYFMVEKEPTLQVLAGIRNSGSAFLIGSPSVQKRGGRYAFYNSAWLVDGGGNLLAKYDKAHLVPFGEYTPFQKWLPFLGKIVEQVGDFVPGKKGHVVSWKERELGIQICYEIIFPYLARAQTRNGADLLVNITNDAWYGRTGGPFQHFSMVVFRAVENRRSLVRAANTGISGFVDPAGRITLSTDLFEEAAVARELPLLKTRTLYTRFGDLFAGTCLIAAIAGIISRSVVGRKKSSA
jgi:apolipoprotein N-acyltransferase